MDGVQLPQPLVYRNDSHSEFVMGLDFNLFIPNQVSQSVSQ